MPWAMGRPKSVVAAKSTSVWIGFGSFAAAE